jgi:hypothetical protein
MKLFQKIVLFTGILMIFTLSVGISVFEHFCKIEGNKISLYVDSNHCEEEKEPCCKSHFEDKNEYESQLENHCCEERISFYQLSEFEVESFHFLILKLNSHFLKSDFSSFSHFFLKNSFEHKPPLYPTPIRTLSNSIHLDNCNIRI